ncbi:MAG TPA: hypothetical protein VF271_04060 [Rhodanobacteraceae bacterium]
MTDVSPNENVRVVNGPSAGPAKDFLPFAQADQLLSFCQQGVLRGMANTSVAVFDGGGWQVACKAA